MKNISKGYQNKTFDPKFNPKKVKGDRRPRPKVHPSRSVDMSVPNHDERRILKARQRMLPSFSRESKKKFIKNFQDNQHREALNKKIAQAHARAVLRKQNASKKPPTKKQVKAAKKLLAKVEARKKRHLKFLSKIK